MIFYSILEYRTNQFTMGAGESYVKRENNLPPEIQDNVVSYLTRPDLQRLSSTSKSLHPHFNPRTLQRADKNYAAIVMAIVKGREEGKRFKEQVENMPDAEKIHFLETMLELTNLRNIFSKQGLFGRLQRIFWDIAGTLRNAESMLQLMKATKVKAPRFYNDPDFMKDLSVYVDVKEQVGFQGSDLPSEKLIDEMAQHDMYLDLDDDDYQGQILVYVVQWVRDDKGMPLAQEYQLHNSDEDDYGISGEINVDDYTSEIHFPRGTYPEQRRDRFTGTLRQ